MRFEHFSHLIQLLHHMHIPAVMSIRGLIGIWIAMLIEPFGADSLVRVNF